MRVPVLVALPICKNDIGILAHHLTRSTIHQLECTFVIRLLKSMRLRKSIHPPKRQSCSTFIALELATDGTHARQSSQRETYSGVTCRLTQSSSRTRTLSRPYSSASPRPILTKTLDAFAPVFSTSSTPKPEDGSSTARKWGVVRRPRNRGHQQALWDECAGY